MAMTSRIPISSKIEFFSITWCLAKTDMASSFGGLEGRLGRGADRLAVTHGHPEIVGHDQRADDEQRAAQRPDHIEGMHRLDGLDERIFEETERRVGAPHQALQ